MLNHHIYDYIGYRHDYYTVLLAEVGHSLTLYIRAARLWEKITVMIIWIKIYEITILFTCYLWKWTLLLY